jgi:hypothetical protein
LLGFVWVSPAWAADPPTKPAPHPVWGGRPPDCCWPSGDEAMAQDLRNGHLAMSKLWRPLVDKGLHAFPHVFCLKDFGKQVSFDLQTGIERCA